MSAAIKLAVFDMENTLTADPTVWELMHLKAGTWESHGLPYWEEYKAGGMHYDEFARRDVATWQGAAVAWFDEAVAEVPLMAGCTGLLAELHRRSIPSAIVSNGLERLGLRLVRELGVARVAANRAVVNDGHMTGEMELLVPFDGKGEVMLRIADELDIAPEHVLAVGDGTADIAMFGAAGRSIAFLPANDNVSAAADHVITEPDLALLIPLLD